MPKARNSYVTYDEYGRPIYGGAPDWDDLYKPKPPPPVYDNNKSPTDNGSTKPPPPKPPSTYKRPEGVVHGTNIWSKADEDEWQKRLHKWDGDLNAALNERKDSWMRDNDWRRKQQIADDTTQILGSANTDKNPAKIAVGGEEGTNDSQGSKGREEGGGKKRGKAAGKMLGFK